jgi:hypothetical protein
MRHRSHHSAIRGTLTVALAVSPIVSACGLSGAVVPGCEGGWTERSVVIARVGDAGEEQMPIAVECWRNAGRERIEVWFTEPAGADCWQLSRLDMRESADAVSITLLAAPRAACAAGDTARRTQVDLQAPIEDRSVLDGSR